LKRGTGDQTFEDSRPGRARLAPEESDLNVAGGLDFDNADALHRGENRGEGESPLSFNPYFARGAGGGADSPIEKGQRRSGGSTDDGAESAASYHSPRHVEGVERTDAQGGERFGDSAEVLAAIKSSTHHESREGHDEGFEAHEDHGVHEEPTPESSGVRRAHVNSIDVMSEVGDELQEGVEEVDPYHEGEDEPDRRGEATIESSRRGESNLSSRIFNEGAHCVAAHGGPTHARTLSGRDEQLSGT
jgi:hypothetical protein